MIFIYFLVALLATVFGSMVGLGGGVVIKPALDAIGNYNLSTISVLSSFTVFSMAVVSIYKRLKEGFKIEKNMLIIILGSIIGGALGSYLFKLFFQSIDNEGYATAIQSAMLAFLLLIVLHKDKFPRFNIKNPIIVFIIGLSLGTISSFLGIGGGPINIVILGVFLNMDMKKSVITSILIILLSQFTKLTLISVTEGFHNYNLTMLCVMIPGGIGGGFIGSNYHDKLTDTIIDKVFNISIVMLIILNVYNLLMNLI